MKEEAPLYLLLAQKEFDWASLPGAKEYNAKLEKKKLAPGYAKMHAWTWKGDRAEGSTYMGVLGGIQRAIHFL